MTDAATALARAVIFDLDGTLVDSAKGIAAALNMVRADRGQGPVALADVKRWVSLGAEALMVRALDATPESVADDLAAFRAVYATIPADPADLFPGALDTVRSLHAQGFRIGICTNKLQSLAAHLVDGLGLGPFVGVVVGGSPGLEPKPHPQSLHLVIDRLGAQVGSSLYVGDSEVDAETAAAAGVPFVLVGHGYVIGPREEIACAALIETLGDLLPVADRLGTPVSVRGSARMAIPRVLSLIARFERLWRYYGAGVVNTAFGYGLFASLVWLGLNLFVAQILAHVTGTVFNYFMFKRFVFTGSRPAIRRYIASYAVNYLIGLGFLAAIRMVVPSPYAAGLLAIVCTSAVNYVILKLFVFRSRPTA